MNETEIYGNFYDKYSSRNPIERFLMTNFFKNCTLILSKIKLNRDDTLLEAGCGEGHFTEFLRSIYSENKIDAFDIGSDCIAQAQKIGEKCNINFFEDNIYAPKKVNSPYSLVVSSEVMEHLENPKEALKVLTGLTSKYVLITVPNEPLWRILNMCRFKYLKRLGNTPGHINHWNIRSFVKLSKQATDLTCIAAVRSIPWLIFLFKKEN